MILNHGETDLSDSQDVCVCMHVKIYSCLRAGMYSLKQKGMYPSTLMEKDFGRKLFEYLSGREILYRQHLGEKPQEVQEAVVSNLCFPSSGEFEEMRNPPVSEMIIFMTRGLMHGQIIMPVFNEEHELVRVCRGDTGVLLDYLMKLDAHSGFMYLAAMQMLERCYLARGMSCIFFIGV